MDKNLLKELKEKLEKEKETVTEQLKSFATEDPKLRGDWDTRFPKHDGGVGSQAMEEAADEVEEYATRLPIEYSLETQLRDINLALEKIEKGNYGRCEKCKQEISEQRLRIYPAARFCLKCTGK